MGLQRGPSGSKDCGLGAAVQPALGGSNVLEGTARSPRLVEQPQRKMRYRFSYLLAAECGLIVGSPILNQLGMDPKLFRVLGIGVFATALYVVIGEGWVTAVAFVLGIPAIGANLLAFFGFTGAFSIPGLVFGVVFMCFVTGVILRCVITTAKVTFETLYGAVSGYVLIGITWGAVYFLIETFWPASFRSSIQAGAQNSGPDFIFFSFVTLTTVGYGDIVPASGLARSGVILEALTGIMYPAVMIARLIALHSAGQGRQS
jgi:hypothetical protein